MMIKISKVSITYFSLCMAFTVFFSSMIASAFDPNTANQFGDGVVNTENTDTSSGKVITNFDYPVTFYSAINLRDGNVLLTGFIKENWEEPGSGDCNFVREKGILVKLSPKGRLVTDFGSGGFYLFEDLDRDYFTKTIEDSEGNLYSIGSSTDYDLTDSDLSDGCDIQNSNPLVLKLDAQGNLVSSFGSEGKVTEISGINDFSAMALYEDRIIIASSSNYPGSTLFALDRTSGNIVNSFGTQGNGKVVFSQNEISQISQILVEDKIYLFGDKNVYGNPTSECKRDGAILQWAINAVSFEGRPVDSFTNRPCGTSFSDGLKEGAYNPVFYRDGSIFVVGGIAKSFTGNLIERYDTKLLKIDGSGNVNASYSKLLDSYFLDAPFSLTQTAYAVGSRTMDSDGRILISHNANPDENAIVRIDEQGLPDSDFGYQGKIRLGGKAGLLFLSNGVLFTYVTYSSNPISSLYVYNIESLRAKRRPIWTNYQRLDNGFSVEIGNYSSDFTYEISLQGTGEMIVKNGRIEVSKLGPNGDRAAISVRTSRAGYRSDVSLFTGRSTSWQSLVISGEPKLSWDGMTLRCTSTGFLSRFDGRDEESLLGPTEIYSYVSDDDGNEVARSSNNSLAISVGRESISTSKYYFCGTKAKDADLRTSRTSLDGYEARLAKERMNLEIQNSRSKNAIDRQLAQQESAKSLVKAREDWREDIRVSDQIKNAQIIQLRILLSEKKLSSSKYLKDYRSVLLVHQDNVKKLTENYKNKLKSIPEDLKILLKSLETQLIQFERDLLEVYWSELEKKGIVVKP